MSEPKEQEEQKSAPVRMLGQFGVGLKTIAALTTGVLGAVFLVLPGCRPLPRDKISASVKVVAYENEVPIEDWARQRFPDHPMTNLSRLIPGPGPILPGDKEAKGLVLYVELSTDGFKRRDIRLRTRVYVVRTRHRVDPREIPATQILPSAGELEIDAPSRSSVQLLFLDDLTTLDGGPFFVRVEAYDDGGILAYDDSPPITDPPMVTTK